MPQHPESPRSSHDQCLRTCIKSQSLEVAHVSKTLEETHLPSHLLMPGHLKEYPGAGIPSTPECCQSFCAFSTAITATSSIKSEEGYMIREEESSPGTSLILLDPRSVPIYALDEEVNLLVNLLLLKYQTKEPITRADTLKIIINKREVHFLEIFLRASECMEMLFGLDLMEVAHTNCCYHLLIKLGLTYDGIKHGEGGLPKTGILILVLSVIFMKGNRATEDKAWEVLNVTGICSGMNHFIFGEPRKLITEDLVKEKYLECWQVANTDPAGFEFLLIPRAHAETTKIKVLEFLAKVNGTDPISFTFQYEDALQDEEERSRARLSD
ncbi:melanoma-associated antigen B16-like [Moschus berezovskii]|uniref:melanoma-associated antigen B16-like n=1 Tax=Moschus berezovskii TaxID=68408 RepID=UPI0024446DB1|nr:melanoma-associated antigen B16-like [Moschus berezovskii]